MTRPAHRGSLRAGPIGWIWLQAALCLCVFGLYLAAFNGKPQLFEQNDAVGDADSAAHYRLISEWSASRQWGDAFESPPPGEHRSAGAQLQEHKIKHPLFEMVGHLLFKGWRAVGLAPATAGRAVGALIGALAIGLLLELMLAAGVGLRVALPLTVMLAVSPAMVIYNGALESWPLSGLLALVALRLHLVHPAALLPFAVFTGISALCNVSAFCWLVLPAAWLVQQHGLTLTLLRRGLLTVAISVASFLVALWLLSLFDPSWRPDRYVAFMRFFSSMYHTEWLDWHPWRIKSILKSLADLFILPLSTIQHDRYLVTWGGGLSRTWRESQLGPWVLSATTLFWLWIGYRFWAARRSADTADSMSLAFAGRTALLVMGSWLFLHFGNYPGMLLYTVSLLPAMVLVAALVLRDHSARHLFALWLLAALVAAASAMQLGISRAFMDTPILDRFQTQAPPASTQRSDPNAR